MKTAIVAVIIALSLSLAACKTTGGTGAPSPLWEKINNGE